MGEILGLMLDTFTTICLAIGLGIIMITNKNLDDSTNRSFVLFVLLVLILNFADIIDFYLSGFSVLSPLRYITSAVGYTLRPASVALIIGILLRRRKAGLIIWMPIIVVGVVAFTSRFTHLIFWFSDANWFIQGPLCYLPHIVGGIYLAALVVLTISMYRYISSGEIFVIGYIAVVCIVAATLETVLSNHKFLLTGAMITSCALYYTVLYIETFRRDPLTGLMNRRSFYLDAKRFCKNTICVISIDLNELKQINDSQGHGAGDRALQSVGSAMLVKSGKHFLAYRVGGDEFMALGKGQTETSVNAYIDEMRSFLKAKGLSASFGYAIYDIGDSFDDICNLADEHMYDDKKLYKRRAIQRG